MTKRIKIIAIATLSMVAACGYLDEKPRTAQVPSTVYTTEEGVRSVLTGIYVRMGFYGDAFYHMGVNSVIITSKNTQGTQLTGVVGEMHPGTEQFMTRPFQNIYSAINQCNDLIANIRASELDEGFREVIEGEAHFLRALNHFNVVRLWGRCPLRITPTTTFEETYCERSSLRKVYAQILDDLDFAFNYMPEKGEQRPGRPHRWAAKALEAKVYVQMGCLTKEHFDCTKELEEDRYTAQEQAGFWQSAYDAALEVYQSGKYSLVPDFATLWNNKTKNTEESIFEMQANPSYGNNRMTEYTIDGLGGPPSAAGNASFFAPNDPDPGGNWGRVRPSKWPFCEHWLKYGNGRVNDISSNAMTNCDPRINITYQYYNDYRPDDPESGTGPSNGLHNIFPHRSYTVANVGQAFPYIRKYYYDEWIHSRGGANMIVYRYADLLLTLAEAANEIGKTNEAIGYVKEVLDRARASGLNSSSAPDMSAQWTGISQEDFREAIMAERIYELIGELHEMFDLRRRGISYMKTCMDLNNYWREKASAPIADDGWNKGANRIAWEALYDTSIEGPNNNINFLIQNLYFPIPKTEIQQNVLISEEDQNFGWEYQ